MELITCNHDRKICNVAFVIGIFILIYNPPIFMFNTMHIVSLFSIIYIFLPNNRVTKMSVNTRYFYLVCGFLGIALYLLIFSVCINGQPLTTVVFPIYYIIDIIPFGIAMKKYAKKHHFSVEWGIDIMLSAGMIQGVFAFAAFCVPSIQTFFVNRMISYGYNEIYTTLSTYRMYGFSNALTNATPVMQSILAILAIWMASNRNRGYYLCALLIFFSAIINARISIVVFLIGIIVLLLLSEMTTPKKIRIILGIIICVVVSVRVILPLISQVSILTYEWITEGFNELLSFGSGVGNYDKYTYFGYLSNMERFILPSDGLAMLIGKGYSIMTSANPSGFQSDIGYIGDMWLGGIFYVLLVYVFFGKIMLKLVKNKNKAIRFLGLLYLVTIPFVNIKGSAFSMNAFMNYLIIMYCLVCGKLEERISIK